MIHELCDMYGLKGMRPAYERNLCTLMFMATLLKVASECKQPIVQQLKKAYKTMMHRDHGILHNHKIELNTIMGNSTHKVGDGCIK